MHVGVREGPSGSGLESLAFAIISHVGCTNGGHLTVDCKFQVAVEGGHKGKYRRGNEKSVIVPSPTTRESRTRIDIKGPRPNTIEDTQDAHTLINQLTKKIVETSTAHYSSLPSSNSLRYKEEAVVGLNVGIEVAMGHCATAGPPTRQFEHSHPFVPLASIVVQIKGRRPWGSARGSA